MNSSILRAARRGVLVLLLALLAAGCAFQNAMSRGEEAVQRGDWDGAVSAYGEAVRLDPKDRDAQSGLAKAKAGAVGVRLAGARDALGRGDLVTAARAAHEANGLLPGEPQVDQLMRDVTASVVATGREDVRAKRFADALTLYADAHAALPEADGAVGPEHAAATDAWVAHLVAGRDAAVKGNRLADALLQDRQLIELQPSAVERARCNQLRTQARPRYEVVLQQAPQDDPDGGGGRRGRHGGHGGPSDLLFGVAQRLAGTSDAQWLRVLGPNDPPGKGPVLASWMREPRLDVDRRVTPVTAQYQAGTRERPNPDYIPLRRRADASEERLRAAEAEEARAQAAVQAAQKEVEREGASPDTQTPAEDALAAAAARVERARREVADARAEFQASHDDLRRVPPVIVEPVFMQHTYEVETHTVRIATTLTTALGTRAKGGPPVSRPIVLEVSDTTARPQPVLGLPLDPLELPSERELRLRLLDAVTAEVGHQLQVAFGQALEDQRARAMALDGDARIEQLVAYLLMDPAIVDPEADALISEVRGIPGAAALVDTCGDPAR